MLLEHISLIWTLTAFQNQVLKIILEFSPSRCERTCAVIGGLVSCRDQFAQTLTASINSNIARCIRACLNDLFVSVCGVL